MGRRGRIKKVEEKKNKYVNYAVMGFVCMAATTHWLPAKTPQHTKDVGSW